MIIGYNDILFDLMMAIYEVVEHDDASFTSICLICILYAQMFETFSILVEFDMNTKCKWQIVSIRFTGLRSSFFGPIGLQSSVAWIFVILCSIALVDFHLQLS